MKFNFNKNYSQYSDISNFRNIKLSFDTDKRRMIIESPSPLFFVLLI